MSVQEALKLGAFDLKKSANRNLAIAFGIALLILGVLIGYPSAAGIFAEKEVPPPPVGPTTLADFEEMEEEKVVEEPPQDEIIPPPPPPPMAVDQTVGTGSDTRMGQLVASDQNLADLPDISDMDDISSSDALGKGDGGTLPDASTWEIDDEKKPLAQGEGNLGDGKPTEDYPEFVPNATKPSYNNADLLSNIEYPPAAREKGTEGTVYVMVKLDTKGKVVEATVVKKVDRLLDEEAVRAVKKTVFSPGIQNGQPIAMRLTLPVTFKLED